MTDPLVRPIAEDMLACLEQEMATLDDPPSQVCIRPGDTVSLLMSTTDDECCRGLAWVRLREFYPTRSFPAQDTEPLNTGPAAFTVTLELGAARCAPIGDEHTIPSCGDWTEVTRKVWDDAAAMRRAVCCYRDQHFERRKRIWQGVYQPLAVEGGCVGGVLPVQIQGPACDCSQTVQS